MSTAARGTRLPNSKRSRASARERQARKSRRLFIAGVGTLIAVSAIAIALSPSPTADGDPGRETASVSITGTALPPLSESDEAIGMTIPEIYGSSFGGGDISIERNGIPKMILFVAHWCPHCQKEVPIIQSWLETEGVPHGIEFISVATATDPGQGNYPPSAWLEKEGWTVPVIVDDEESSAGESFGVNAYPYFVFVNGDGTVRHRASGELTIEHIKEFLSGLVSEH